MSFGGAVLKMCRSPMQIHGNEIQTNEIFSFGLLFRQTNGKMSEFDIILDNSQQNLKQVPVHILDMYNLKMLYLQGNQIQYLPDEFFLKLAKLTWLDLRNNQLKKIPETIAFHNNLENLLLSDNRLEALPNELGLVPKLTVLQVGNNPLLYPNRKIISQGTAIICTYLKMEYEKKHPVIDTLIPEDMSVSQIEEEIPTVRKLGSNFTKSRTSLTIRPLSRPDERIIHKISKGISKISLKSYYDPTFYVRTGTQTSDENLFMAEHLKNQWLSKLRILLAEQERILQQERNLKALDTWRSETKMKPVHKVSKDVISAAPFGTYEEYNTMLSREEVAKEVDRFMLNAKKPPEKQDTEKLINSLIAQLKEFENSNREDKSKNELYDAGQQILKMVDIHKKIMELQGRTW